jgi:hypothetical protein
MSNLGGTGKKNVPKFWKYFLQKFEWKKFLTENKQKYQKRNIFISGNPRSEGFQKGTEYEGFLFQIL